MFVCSKLLLIFISYVLSAAFAGKYLTNITYVSFLQPNPSPVSEISNTSIYLSNVSLVDDSPLQYVQLPFMFPYNGYNINSLWVSPNGGLFQYNHPPCGGSWFWTERLLNCNLDTRFDGLIAGFYTDLYPGSYVNASITYTTQFQYIKFQFTNIPFYTKPLPVVNDNQTITFGISLYSDGQIVLSYDYLLDDAALKVVFENASDVGQFDDYISGLRPIRLPSVDPTLVIYTSEQIENGLNTWNTPMAGIYPPTKNLTSDTSFTMCPISTTWMMTPNGININGDLGMLTTVSLKPLSISCFYDNSMDFDSRLNNSISLGIYVLNSDDGFNTDTNGYFMSESINASDAHAVGTTSSDLITDCIFTSLNGERLLFNESHASGEDVYVTCNITADQLINGAAVIDSVVDRYIGVAWRQSYVHDMRTSDILYHTLPIPPMPLFIFNSTSSVTSNSLLNCSINDRNAINTTTYTASYAMGITPECSLYHGNLTELDLTCPAPPSDPSGIYLPYTQLYETESCNSACDQYSYDNNFECCDSSEIDCSGICYGNAKYAIYTNELQYCCSNVDACNVCNGTDWNGYTCNTGLWFNSTFDDNGIYSYYDIEGNATSSDIENFTLTNQNTVYAVDNIWFEFLQQSVEFDPFISLMNDNYAEFQNINTSVESSPIFSLGVNESLTVVISSDLSRLVGSIERDFHRWEVKELKIHYTINSIQYYYMFGVYPTAYNCQAIGAGKAVSSSCSRLPGCIYCISYDDMRMLRSVEEQEEVDGNALDVHLNAKRRQYFKAHQRSAMGVVVNENQEGVSNQTQRALFAAIIPPAAGFIRYDGGGQCSEGWLTDSCPLGYVSSDASNNPSLSRFSFVCVSVCIVLLTLLM